MNKHGIGKGSTINNHANSSKRLEMLKKQYSERRRMIENDLLREAMYIKEMEAKLQDIQMHKVAADLGGNRPSEKPHHHVQWRKKNQEELEAKKDDIVIQDPPPAHPLSVVKECASKPNPAAALQATLSCSASFSESKTEEPQANNPAIESESSRDIASSSPWSEYGPRWEQPPSRHEDKASHSCFTKSQVAKIKNEDREPQEEKDPQQQQQQQQDCKDLDKERMDLKDLSVQQVGNVLKHNNLGLYEGVFCRNCVDGETLQDPTLCDKDLQELGMTIRIHRKRLLDLVSRYKRKGVPMSDLVPKQLLLIPPPPSTEPPMMPSMPSCFASSPQRASPAAFPLSHTPSPSPTRMIKPSSSLAPSTLSPRRVKQNNPYAQHSPHRPVPTERQHPYSPFLQTHSRPRSSSLSTTSSIRSANQQEAFSQHSPPSHASMSASSPMIEKRVNIGQQLHQSQDPPKEDGVAGQSRSIPETEPIGDEDKEEEDRDNDEENDDAFASDFDEDFSNHTESLGDIIAS